MYAFRGFRFESLHIEVVAIILKLNYDTFSNICLSVTITIPITFTFASPMQGKALTINDLH